MQLLLKIIALGGLVDAISMLVAPDVWKRFWHDSVAWTRREPAVLRTLGVAKFVFFIALLFWNPRRRVLA